MAKPFPKVNHRTASPFSWLSWTPSWYRPHPRSSRLELCPSAPSTSGARRFGVLGVGPTRTDLSSLLTRPLQPQTSRQADGQTSSRHAGTGKHRCATKNCGIGKDERCPHPSLMRSGPRRRNARKPARRSSSGARHLCNALAGSSWIATSCHGMHLSPPCCSSPSSSLERAFGGASAGHPNPRRHNAPPTPAPDDPYASTVKLWIWNLDKQPLLETTDEPSKSPDC